MPLELCIECTVDFVCIENFLKGYFRTCLIIIVAFNRTNPCLTMQQVISVSVREEDADNGWCVSVL